ncbi:MAG TPA: hypothetical protein VGF18_07860 [Candidatus Tumulicola sp.]
MTVVGARVNFWRILGATSALALAAADSTLVRSSQLPVEFGTEESFLIFWIAMVAFAIAVIPRRTWAQATVISCAVIGWPVAFWTAQIAAVGCGGISLVDLFATAFALAPFLALLVPIWMPIPFAAVCVVAAGAIGIYRHAPRPLPWWTLVLAISSIPAVLVLSHVTLKMAGVHTLDRPCWTM